MLIFESLRIVHLVSNRGPQKSMWCPDVAPHVDLEGQMFDTSGFTSSALFFLQKLKPEQVYHVVVAPCFDKKLEAVREEYYNSLLETRDVDCVLTSGISSQETHKRFTTDYIHHHALIHPKSIAHWSPFQSLSSKGDPSFHQIHC